MKKITQSSPKTLSEKIAATLSIYLKTQLLLMFFVGGLVWILLTLLRVPYALLLAVLTGTFSVVPVVGFAVSAIIAALVAGFDGVRFLPQIPELFEAVAVLLLFGILNIVLDYFIMPLFLGRVTNIHPLVLFLAVVIGTLLFNIPGAILAVPTALIVRTIVDHYNQQPEKQ